MALSEEGFKKYWRTISGISDRLHNATAFMRNWATEIPAHGDDGLLGEIADELTRGVGPAPPQDWGLAGAGSDLGAAQTLQKQLVTPGDNRFIGGVRLLVEELRLRLQSLPDTPDRRKILALLSFDVHQLGALFGSFTAAWDKLVILKYETSIPNPRQRKLDAWFMALVGVNERFIRDVVGTTILYLGRDLIAQPLLRSLSVSDMNLPSPTYEQLMRHLSTEAALAEIVLSYMDRSARHTTRFAGRLAPELGTSFVPADESGFAPGILSELDFLPNSTEAAWLTVLNLRDSMIHDTTHELRAGRAAGPHEVLYELDLPALQLLADFLCALTFGFSARMLVAVAELAAVSDEVDAPVHSLVAEFRRQFSGELRVLLLRLLKAERYGLAWALAEAAMRAEPPDSQGHMLKLNSFFARQNFGQGYVERSEIEALGEYEVPRYRILQLVLLNELRRQTLEPLLDEAVTSKNVTIEELEDWPALARLRQTPWWRSWTARHT